MSAGELGPFASVGVALGVPADPPEVSEDPPETSFVVAGGVALSVDVSVDAPASGEAAEGLDFPVGEPTPDLSVGVPVASGVALEPAVGDPAPESGVEGTEGGSFLPFIFPLSVGGASSHEGVASGLGPDLEGLPAISSQTGNINHGYRTNHHPSAGRCCPWSQMVLRIHRMYIGEIN